MTLTELRETLTAVSEAAPVPTPDPAAFQRRVTGVRRRRTAVRVAGAAAAVAVVATGSALVAGGTPGHDEGTSITRPTADGPSAQLPVIVDGHLRTLSADGELGAKGPSVVRLVGRVPEGLVAIDGEGDAVRVSPTGATVELVDGPVRTAYLDGDTLVYQRLDDPSVHWRRVSPKPQATDSQSTIDALRLFGAGDGGVVVARVNGIQLLDDTGAHRLTLPADTEVIHQVEVAGGVVAVRTDRGDLLFTDHGRHSVTLPGDRYAALAPDGASYARATDSRTAAELVDPATGARTPVPGVTGRIVGLAWAGAGQLYVLVAHPHSRTVWSCPSGTTCTELYDDPTGTLALR